MGTQRARSTGTGAQERALEAAMPGAPPCPQEREEGRPESVQGPTGPPQPLLPELQGRGGAREMSQGTSRGVPSGAGQGTSILRTQEATVGTAGGGGKREAAVT